MTTIQHTTPERVWSHPRSQRETCPDCTETRQRPGGPQSVTRDQRPGSDQRQQNWLSGQQRIKQREQREAEQRNAPAFVHRMSEREVYDLATVSGPALGYPRKTLIERAERAIDLACFPGRDQEGPKAQLTEMLHRGESENSSSDRFALHILSTGSEGYRTAFLKTISVSGTGDIPILSPEEIKACQARLYVRAMGVATGGAGGFTSPFTLDSSLLPVSAGSRSSFRNVCRVEQTTNNEWRSPTSGGVSMAYQTEGAVATDNSPTLAQPTLTLNRAVGFVPVSRELYADWNGALDQLGAEFQRAKDDLEATKFAVGTGTNEPQGLVTGATQTETATGVATIAPVDLYDTEQVLPARYRDRAHWFANKTIINDLLKDLPTNAGAAGIWLPSGRPEDQRGNTGYTLIGYEANEASGMASVLTTGTKVAILGDPSMFLIVDHVGGLEVEVIAHLTQQATAGAGVGLPTGQRGIWAVFRNTSKVLDASAFRALITG